MLLKVVNLTNQKTTHVTNLPHFRKDYSVRFSPVLYQLSSFFFKNGLRIKMITVLGFLFNNYHDSFDLTTGFFGVSSSYKFVNFYKTFIDQLADMFTFYDLNLIIKKLRTSRKVRKYSKGKLRYKSRLLLIRERQMFGIILRLWKICHSSMGEEGENFRQRVIFSFFLIDESLLPETTPVTIQETMLDLYIKETSNSRR